MHSQRQFRRLLTALAIIIVGVAISRPALAAVVKPQLDITQLGGDAGISGAAGVLSLDATAIAIINVDNTVTDIPDSDFLLTASFLSSTGPMYTYGPGTFSAGSYLSGTFASLTVVDLGAGFAQYFADLAYSGGSLQGAFAGGRIEGGFMNLTGDLATSFSGSALTAKLGPVTVVPVPATLPLFLSALAGLGALRRRK